MTETSDDGMPPVQCKPEELLDKLPNQQAAVEFEDTCQALMRVLDPDLKEVAELRFFQEWTIEEIADKLHLSQRAIFRRQEKIWRAWNKYFAELAE